MSPSKVSTCCSSCNHPNSSSADLLPLHNSRQMPCCCAAPLHAPSDNHAPIQQQDCSPSSVQPFAPALYLPCRLQRPLLHLERTAWPRCATCSAGSGWGQSVPSSRLPGHVPRLPAECWLCPLHVGRHPAAADVDAQVRWCSGLQPLYAHACHCCSFSNMLVQLSCPTQVAVAQLHAQTSPGYVPHPDPYLPAAGTRALLAGACHRSAHWLPPSLSAPARPGAWCAGCMAPGCHPGRASSPAGPWCGTSSSAAS